MDYIFGDPHFFHNRMVKLRGYENKYEMNNDIRKSINSVVHNKYDTIIFNGDISFLTKEDTRHLISQINGYKVLIMGNHDYRHSKKWWHDVGFDDVIDGHLLKDNIIISHKPIDDLPKGYFNIHAHTHGFEHKYSENPSYFCTSFEKIKKPMMLKTIKEKEFCIKKEK